MHFNETEHDLFSALYKGLYQLPTFITITNLNNIYKLLYYVPLISYGQVPK
jgi:hypothetical protein